MAEPLLKSWVPNAATAQNLSNGEVTITKIYCVNTGGAVAYIQLFNAASVNVVAGTTVPFMSLVIPATSGVLDMDFHPPLRVDTRLSAFTSTAVGAASAAPTGSAYIQIFVN